MKPDIKLFKHLTDDAKFLQWKEHFITTCTGASLAECCDFTFIPSPAEEKSFENKDKWMYTILMNIVKTPGGIDIIRKHKVDRSGRKVLFDLIQDNAKSATADIRATELLEEITNLRLDSSWEKSTYEFILYLEQVLEDYNESVRYDSQRLTPDMKRAMVERAVMSNRSLRNIKDRETDRIAQMGDTGRFDYRTFMFLLREAAKTVDTERAQRNRTRRRRSANVHIQEDSDEASDGDNGDIAQAFQVWLSRQFPGSRMNKETWTSLDPATQKVWDSIDDKDKAAILSYAEKRAEKRSQDKSARSANVHEGDHGQESDGEESSEEAPNQELEANVTKGVQEANETKGKAHPGDIRRVLGGNKKSDKKTRSANNIMWNLHTMHRSPKASDDTAPGETELLPPLEDGEGSSSDDGSIFDPSKMLEEYWGEQEDQFFP
jgi:hypothetical protein